jgi:hypothetical protein
MAKKCFNSNLMTKIILPSFTIKALTPLLSKYINPFTQYFVYQAMKHSKIIALEISN